MTDYKFDRMNPKHARAYNKIVNITTMPTRFAKSSEWLKRAGINTDPSTSEYYYGMAALHELADEGILVRHYTTKWLEWCRPQHTTLKSEPRKPSTPRNRSQTKTTPISASFDAKMYELIKDVAYTEHKSMDAVIKEIVLRHKDELESRKLPYDVAYVLANTNLTTPEQARKFIDNLKRVIV